MKCSKRVKMVMQFRLVLCLLCVFSFAEAQNTRPEINSITAELVADNSVAQTPVRTEERDSSSVIPRNDSLAALRKNTLKVLPLAFYYSFFTKNTNRKSNVRFFATYTQNQQFFVILPWQIYTADEKYFINGNLDYKLFPEYYYGLGNKTEETDRHLYAYEALTFNNKALKNIGNHTFLGLATQYQNLATMLPHHHSEMDMRDCNIIGDNGYEYAAAGPSIMYDTRDHILCPQIGQYFEFTGLAAAGKANGETINFVQLSLDYRHYLNVTKGGTWANQLVVQASLGNVPYRALPTLGGAYFHRGYYAGRFRDYNLALYQTEYRQHVWNRFGVVAFASAGRVFQSLKMNPLEDINMAAGLGLRIRLSKNEQTNIRLDYSFAKDSQGFYVYFAEAF
jgi:outer membrane protein assembly factor BamA